MNKAAPFQMTITHLRGRLVFASREGEGYRFTPEQLEKMVNFFHLMLPWTQPRAPTKVDVGPYICLPTNECEVRCPFELADGTEVFVPLSSDWLIRMRPVLERAVEILNGSPEQPAADFTLELKDDGDIVLLPPDRTTLRPA